MTTVAVSGGFDPIHRGHIQYIQDAAKYGDVVVILNSDAWLERKKGKAFMSFDERKAILMAIKGVVDVTEAADGDGTVCETLRRIKPDYFAKGGDRIPENTPELALCVELGIKPIFGVGGSKVSSSSDLLEVWQEGYGADLADISHRGDYIYALDEYEQEDGDPSHTSQYGVKYITFRMHLDYVEPDELLSMAEAVIQKYLYEREHNKIVWRRRPRISYTGKGEGRLCSLYARFHTMGQNTNALG